jgi:hypothetical protein
LTLKVADADREFFVMQPYRFVSAPALKKLSKNKVTIALALHQQGVLCSAF